MEMVLEAESYRQNKIIPLSCGYNPLVFEPFYRQFAEIQEPFPVINPTCVRLQGHRHWIMVLEMFN